MAETAAGLKIPGITKIKRRNEYGEVGGGKKEKEKAEAKRKDSNENKETFLRNNRRDHDLKSWNSKNIGNLFMYKMIIDQCRLL